MRILFNIAHPAQVHLFKNLIWNLEKKGHKCKITTVNKDVSLDLLKTYGFNYEIVGSARSTLFSKATELIKIEYNLYKIARPFKPDILIGGVGNAYVAHVGKLLKVPSIVFDDTEHAKISHFIMDPFADVICTPSCFINNIGKNQIRYNGYHQLAYLHPNYFNPNPDVLDQVGLCKSDKYTIIRLVSWDADHDIGQKGIQNKKEFILELEKYGKVLICAEGELDKELEKYRIKVSPEKIHDLLYYASLYIGEGATMATESVILGTPSIYISSLAGKIGNFIDLEKNYELMFNYFDSDKATKKAFELINKPNLKEEWKIKINKLLKDKIDVTAFMVWFIENYPNSFQNMKQNKIPIDWLY